MKKLIASIALTLVLAGNAFAGLQGQQLTTTAPLTIRSAAILTTSDVASTTVTVPANVTAVRVYAEFTIGSLTNVVITPIGQVTPAGTVYAASDKAITLTAGGNESRRIDVEQFPGRNIGFSAKGTGTVTNSNLALRYKFEYK